MADAEFSSKSRPLETMSTSPMRPASVSASPLSIEYKLALGETAQEITKNIQKSLSSSLKLEEEAKNCVSRNHRQSRSSLGTPVSLTPSKGISPSKLKVRFEDQNAPKTDVSNTDETVQSLSHENKTTTPTKTSRQDFIFNSPDFNTSPVKTIQENIKAHASRTPLKSNIEASLLSSLKLPQNDEERQKLNEFLRNMETSASGDPLATLFDLEYDLKLSDLINSKPAVSKNGKASTSVVTAASKVPEKDGEFQIKRRKGVAKRNLEKKDFSKKTLKPRKENYGKNATVKSSINTVWYSLSVGLAIIKSRPKSDIILYTSSQFH